MSHHQVRVLLARLMPGCALGTDLRQDNGFANTHFERRSFATSGTLPEILCCAYQPHWQNWYVGLFDDVGNTWLCAAHGRHMRSSTFRGNQKRITRFEDTNDLCQENAVIITAMDRDDPISF